MALAAAVAAPAGLAVVAPAWAATSCRVDYSVPAQWSGGFVANVNVTNTGDSVNGWAVTWNYGAGQRVASGWNADLSQSNSTVTARNVGYNGSIASGGTTSFGFQGTSNGSTNPAPTAFALNGTACGGAGVPTPGPTATPIPPTVPPSTPPGGNFTNCKSDQWATFTDGPFTLYNNIWGGGAGSQQLCVNSASQFRVVANHPNTGGIKSYPNASLDLNRRLSSLKSLTSSFDVSVPGSGSYVTAYDLWANNNAYEIMVWMNRAGAVGPIADAYDGNGAVPAARNVNVGGHTWNIFRGSNGANAVYSFVRTSNTSSGTVDLLALFNWLKSNGWWDDVMLGSQQFGYEITSANGGLTFTTNRYSLTFS